MICLSGFELYFRWVPLVGVTHGMHYFVQHLSNIMLVYCLLLLTGNPPPPSLVL